MSGRQTFEQQTWIDPEEYAYPAGSIRQSRRKFRALLTANKLTGEGHREKLETRYVGRYVSGTAGIPDTYFTIPARCKDKGRTLSGYLSVDSSGALIFSVPSRKVQPNPPASNNPPRIVHRVNGVKVYYDSSLQEYEVCRASEKRGDGYFTSDKQDAIDTASTIAKEEKTRRNPGSSKFDTDLDELVYQLSLEGPDETMGTVDTTGFYALLLNIGLDDLVLAAKALNVKDSAHSSYEGYVKEALKESLPDMYHLPQIHAIMSEDGQGFVNVTYYNNKKRAQDAWKVAERAIGSEFDDEED